MDSKDKQLIKQVPTFDVNELEFLDKLGEGKFATYQFQ